MRHARPKGRRRVKAAPRATPCHPFWIVSWQMTRSTLPLRPRDSATPSSTEPVLIRIGCLVEINWRGSHLLVR